MGARSGSRTSSQNTYSSPQPPQPSTGAPQQSPGGLYSYGGQTGFDYRRPRMAGDGTSPRPLSTEEKEKRENWAMNAYSSRTLQNLLKESAEARPPQLG